MKNELILAKRLGPGHTGKAAQARARLQAILDELGLQELHTRFAV
jgi:hypothetical protein